MRMGIYNARYALAKDFKAAATPDPGGPRMLVLNGFKQVLNEYVLVLERT